MTDVQSNQILLAFSIIIASLIVSGSIFFAVGSLNTNLSGLVNAGGTIAAPSQQPTPTPTPIQQPTAQAQQPSGNANIQELINDPSFTKGDPKAPVVMVEFSDFQCQFCRRFYDDALPQVEKEYIQTGKVFFVYKDFPLSFHPMAQPAAEGTRCAADQGKALEMHDTIFNFQNTKGQGTIQWSVDELKQEAQKIGLNMTEFNSCLDTGKYTKIV